MESITYPRRHHRLALRAGVLLLAVVLCASLAGQLTTTVFAQGGTGRPISVGDVVTGTLNAQNFMQVYALTASAGDSITVDVTTEVDALAPVVVITDQRGNVIAQDLDLETPTTASIADLTIPSSGVFHVTVMRGSGAQGDASGVYTLRMSGIQQVGGLTVTLPDGGITFELTWNAAVNLNMEVRDPVGGTVQRFNTGSPSGGTLDADINANCDSATADSPTEVIAWSAGTVPAGSYEIIVYYTDVCNVGGPQMFTLTTSVNAETSQTLTGTINPGQEYLARLVLSTDGTWTMQNGGVNAGLDTAIFRNQITNADPVALGSAVSGTLTNASPARAYSFDGTAGTTVQIDMRATSGSLDPYLVLLGPDSSPLANNDDASDQTTDSAITRSLAADGKYTVIATRYGLTIGGTEGDYTLSLATVAENATPVAGQTTVTPAPTGTTLTEGFIDVKLEWTTNADVQLLVRDPNGDSVYDDSPTIQSGGILEAGGNVGCTNTTTSPVSYIYWPANRQLPGVYEIEVWYQNSCDDTSPVNFGLSVTVQGQTVINTVQSASLNSRYMITFRVESDGTAIAGPGGFFDMTNASTLNYQTMLASATNLSYGQTVSGSVTDQQRFVVYSFVGTQGDQVTIGMNETGGNLDPALYLISPEGIQVAYNDDVVPVDNPNSVIDKVTLASSGTYYIIATHYGLNVGGTQGTYTLTLVQD